MAVNICARLVHLSGEASAGSSLSGADQPATLVLEEWQVGSPGDVTKGQSNFGSDARHDTKPGAASAL